MIFANPLILNTPALLRLGAVEVNKIPPHFDFHKILLIDRVADLVAQEIEENSKDHVCEMLVGYLGQEGLQECLTMTPYQIAEATILHTSPCAALLSDLRNQWANVSRAEIYEQPFGFEEEIERITLDQWLETLVSEYVEIR